MMESLSSVPTIVGIAQDILSAVETASRNKRRCEKIADRVRCVKAVLEQAQALDEAQDQDGTTAAAAHAATSSLLGRLEAALGRALKVVRGCRRGSFLGSVFAAGGRMADLDAAEREIDSCILDLTFANSLRLERLLRRRQQDVVAGIVTEHGEEEEKKSSVPEEKKAVPVGSGGAEMDPENATATAAIGVPVCTVTAAAHGREMAPPPCYGYGYGNRGYDYYWRNHGCDCDGWHDRGGGGPSDAAFYYTQYSSRTSMFSDDNPNSCTIL